jgi:hypothetical protein
MIYGLLAEGCGPPIWLPDEWLRGSSALTLGSAERMWRNIRRQKAFPYSAVNPTRLTPTQALLEAPVLAAYGPSRTRDRRGRSGGRGQGGSDLGRCLRKATRMKAPRTADRPRTKCKVFLPDGGQGGRPAGPRRLRRFHAPEGGRRAVSTRARLGWNARWRTQLPEVQPQGQESHNKAELCALGKLRWPKEAATTSTSIR